MRVCVLTCECIGSSKFMSNGNYQLPFWQKKHCPWQTKAQGFMKYGWQRVTRGGRKIGPVQWAKDGADTLLKCEMSSHGAELLLFQDAWKLHGAEEAASGRKWVLHLLGSLKVCRLWCHRHRSARYTAGLVSDQGHLMLFWLSAKKKTNSHSCWVFMAMARCLLHTTRLTCPLEE